MVSLVAILSSGKGTWGQVNALIKSAKWKQIYLLCNEFAHSNFETNSQNIIKLKIDENKPQEMFEKLSKFFKTQIKDFEVALNISSGTGMEHMATLSAILKAGLGVRFVYAEGQELKEFEILDEKYVPEEEENGF